jgi:Cullin family
MLFNDSATLSLDAIRSATNIAEGELRRHLLSLCTPKLKVLKKLSKGKGIADSDSFTFNEEFTSKFKRMKVPLISEAGGSALAALPKGAHVLCNIAHLCGWIVILVIRAITDYYGHDYLCHLL